MKNHKKWLVPLTIVLAVVLVALSASSYLYQGAFKPFRGKNVRIFQQQNQPNQGVDPSVPGSNLEISIIGNGVSIPGTENYVADFTQGNAVEVYDFNVSNGTYEDVWVYRLTAEYSASGVDNSLLRGTDAWTLYNANDLSTPLAHATVGNYGHIVFELSGDPVEIERGGDGEDFVITTVVMPDAANSGDLMLNVWLQEDADASIGTTDYTDFVDSAVVWRGEVYGYNYDGYYVDFLPTGTQRWEDSALTRAELAQDLVEATGVPIDTCGGQVFIDVPVSHDYYDYIQTVYCQGWIIGYNNGTFGPSDMINRAEGAKSAYVAFSLSDESGVPHFSDVDPNAWYYPYVETLYYNGALLTQSGDPFYPSYILTENTLAYWLSQL